MKNFLNSIRVFLSKKPGQAILAAGLLALTLAAAPVAAQNIVTSSGVWYRNGTAMLLNPSTLEIGSSATRIAKGWFTALDATTLTLGGAVTGDVHVNDDAYVSFGNTYASPDAKMGWNTAQTVDGLYIATSTAQNTAILAELGDVAYDFAHGAATNPTLFVHSAAQSTTQWLSLSHDQTNAVIDVGTGVVSIPDGISTAGITATSFVIGANTLDTTEWAFLDGQNQAVATTSNPTFGNLTITSFASNWTNAGRTVADLGIVTTADIDGGTIDGATIGGVSAGDGTFNTLTVNTNLLPDANDGAGLGISGTAFSDVFLASGAIIDFAAGDVTITHSSNILTVAGGVTRVEGQMHVAINSTAPVTMGAANALFINRSGVAGQVSINDATLPVQMSTASGGGNSEAYYAVNSGETGSYGVLFGYAQNNPTFGDAGVFRVIPTSASLEFIVSGSVLALTVAPAGNTTWASSASASGVPTMVKWTPPANTGMTTLTEVPQFNFLASTQGWAQGNITTQRYGIFGQPTYLFATSSSTITNSIAWQFVGAPIASTNAVFTNTYAVQMGGTATIGATSAGMTYAALDLPAHTITVTGSTQVTSANGFGGQRIGIVTLTDASAVTVDNAASLYIAGAVAQAGSVTITNAYSIFVDAGLSRFDGNVFMGNDALILRDVNVGLTASGTTQGAALGLTAEYNEVTTVDTNEDGVRLPAAEAGKTVVIVNRDDASAVKIFPASGDKINSAATDASLNLSFGQMAYLWAKDDEHWFMTSATLVSAI